MSAPVPAERLTEMDDALHSLVEPEKPVHAATGDPEIAALYAINGALSDLDDYAIKRVLVWAADKHGINLA